MCETLTIDLVIVGVCGIPKHDTAEVFGWRIIPDQELENLFWTEVKDTIKVRGSFLRSGEADEYLCGRIHALFDDIYPTVKTEAIVERIVNEVTGRAATGVVELDEDEIEPRGQDNGKKIQVWNFALRCR